MVDKLNIKPLYLLVLFLSFAVVLIALGGGLFNQDGAWFTHWQHKLFSGLCHQTPQRSFWISGSPMAVCTRCFGIYSAFAAAWLAVPVFGSVIEVVRPYVKKGIIPIILLNLADWVGNVLGFWENTLISRFLVGQLLGISAAFLLAQEFLRQQKTNIGIRYGTDRINEQ